MSRVDQQSVICEDYHLPPNAEATSLSSMDSNQDEDVEKQLLEVFDLPEGIEKNDKICALKQLMELQANEKEKDQQKISQLESQVQALQQQLEEKQRSLQKAKQEIEKLQESWVNGGHSKELGMKLESLKLHEDSPEEDEGEVCGANREWKLPPLLSLTSNNSSHTPLEDLDDMTDIVDGMLKAYERQHPEKSKLAEDSEISLGIEEAYGDYVAESDNDADSLSNQSESEPSFGVDVNKPTLELDENPYFSDNGITAGVEIFDNSEPRTSAESPSRKVHTPQLPHEFQLEKCADVATKKKRSRRKSKGKRPSITKRSASECKPLIMKQKHLTKELIGKGNTRKTRKPMKKALFLNKLFQTSRSALNFHIDSPTIKLGAHQHQNMLQNLRFVRSVARELPWAKGRLQKMLKLYTDKEITKEEMYPELCDLSKNVQGELEDERNKVRLLSEKRNKLSLKLTIAQEIVSQTQIVKCGRKGKPHGSGLMFEFSNPTMLYWQSKNGERSKEGLSLLEVRSITLGHETAVFRRSTNQKISKECCLSLVTKDRTLDIAVKSDFQRNWLVKSLGQLVKYARDWQIAYLHRAKKLQQHQKPKVIRRS